GRQVGGKIIGQLRGIDGLFVHYCLTHHDLPYVECRSLVEFLLDDDRIQRLLDRKANEKRKEWIKNRLRERRREEPQVTFEDVEEEYEQTFPRELTPIEKIHSEFTALLPHPELHGGKQAKNVWATIEERQLGFMDFVEEEGLQHEEGSLFSYLARITRV